MLSTLAIEAAKSASDGVAIAGGFRRVTELNSPHTGAGEAGVKQALSAARAGQAIDYVGATVPLHFDQNGDIAVPFVTWTLDAKGELAITGRIPDDEAQNRAAGWPRDSSIDRVCNREGGTLPHLVQTVAPTLSDLLAPAAGMKPL